MITSPCITCHISTVWNAIPLSCTWIESWRFEVCNEWLLVNIGQGSAKFHLFEVRSHGKETVLIKSFARYYYPGKKKRTIIKIRGEKNAVPRVISCSIRRDQRRASPIRDCPRLLPCADRAWSSMISHVNSVLLAGILEDGSFFLSRVVFSPKTVKFMMQFVLFNSWSSVKCSGAKMSCLKKFDVMALFAWADYGAKFITSIVGRGLFLLNCSSGLKTKRITTIFWTARTGKERRKTSKSFRTTT